MHGVQFESLIDTACTRYMIEGAAYIEKSSEPMKPLKPIKAGQFVAVYTKKAQPDFKGTLKGGRAVVFEAKHTESTRIEQNRVTDEQAAALDMHQSLGAACFVLVSFRFESFYRVPWTVWSDMPGHFGKKSANEKDLEPYKLNGILHFLDRLEATM